MTRDELIEWMGNQNLSTYNGVNVVIDCPSSPEEAQEVADVIEEILGGSFNAKDDGGRWWRWLWLHLVTNNRHINAYNTSASKERIAQRFKNAEIIPAEEALRMIRGDSSGLIVVDDLL